MKKNILIVGCGNLGNHLLPKLFNKFNVFATNRKIKYKSKIGFTNIELDLSLYPKKKLPSIFNIVEVIEIQFGVWYFFSNFIHFLFQKL